VFGQGFENCKIPVEYDSKQSPVIIKFDFTFDDEGATWKTEINTDLFPSITGDEFSFTFGGSASSGQTGTWSYNPGENDPVITFFVAKGGNFFNLFKNEDGDNTGTWSTPVNSNNGKNYGLSHLTFYDTGKNDGGGGSSEVPEPASMLLFGAGLLGLGLSRRRSKLA